MERALIGEYETLIDEILAKLTPQNHALAVELASIPEHIRGYGHVKDRHLKDAKAREAALLGAFRGARSRIRPRKWRSPPIDVGAVSAVGERRRERSPRRARDADVPAARSTRGARVVRRAGLHAVRVPGRSLGRLRARRIRPDPRAHRHGQDLRGVARAARCSGPTARADAPPPLTRAVDHAAARARRGHRARARARRRRAAAALDRRRAHRRHAGRRRARARTGGCRPRSSPRPRA